VPVPFPPPPLGDVSRGVAGAGCCCRSVLLGLPPPPPLSPPPRAPAAAAAVTCRASTSAARTAAVTSRRGAMTLSPPPRRELTETRAPYAGAVRPGVSLSSQAFDRRGGPAVWERSSVTRATSSQRSESSVLISESNRSLLPNLGLTSSRNCRQPRHQSLNPSSSFE
jgi:hypothetical protein